MNPGYEAIAHELRRQREALLKEVADTEADLQFIAEDRQSELEERAQEEHAARLFARLDVRGKYAIEEIDAALLRIARKTYGTCTECGDRIPRARLRAVPATPFCIACARAQETGAPGAETEVPESHRGSLPADFSLLSDRELEAALRDQVREDDRIDAEELRIVCRHGVVYLDGAVPSEAVHQMLRKLVTDVAGLQEIVDRVQVKEILWDRPDRSKRTPPENRESALGPEETEDIFRSQEEGLDYAPPAEPPPEEE